MYFIRNITITMNAQSTEQAVTCLKKSQNSFTLFLLQLLKIQIRFRFIRKVKNSLTLSQASFVCLKFSCIYICNIHVLQLNQCSMMYCLYVTEESISLFSDVHQVWYSCVLKFECFMAY